MRKIELSETDWKNLRDLCFQREELYGKWMQVLDEREQLLNKIRVKYKLGDNSRVGIDFKSERIEVDE